MVAMNANTKSNTIPTRASSSAMSLDHILNTQLHIDKPHSAEARRSGRSSAPPLLHTSPVRFSPYQRRGSSKVARARSFGTVEPLLKQRWRAALSLSPIQTRPTHSDVLSRSERIDNLTTASATQSATAERSVASIDQVAERPQPGQPAIHKPLMDVYRINDPPCAILTLDLPGLQRRDVRVRTVHGDLHVVGRSTAGPRLQFRGIPISGQYVVQERKTGFYEKWLKLPTWVKEDAITAEMKDGVLMLMLPAERTRTAAMTHQGPRDITVL